MNTKLSTGRQSLDTRAGLRRGPQSGYTRIMSAGFHGRVDRGVWREYVMLNEVRGRLQEAHGKSSSGRGKSVESVGTSGSPSSAAGGNCTHKTKTGISASGIQYGKWACGINFHAKFDGRPDRVSLPIPPPVDSSQQRNMTEQPQSSNTYTDVDRIYRNSLGMALSPPESMTRWLRLSLSLWLTPFFITNLLVISSSAEPRGTEKGSTHSCL